MAANGRSASRRRRVPVCNVGSGGICACFAWHTTGVTPTPLRCYTLRVPTTHRRHAITETDEIRHALDAAKRAWPHLADRPSALLRELILAGENALDNASDRRLAAIESTSGTLTGTFPSGYLDNIRQDWPE